MANAKDHDEKEPKIEKVENQSDLLRNRVNSIMDLVDDDDDVDEELLEELKKPKKKFFGLF